MRSGLAACCWFGRECEVRALSSAGMAMGVVGLVAAGSLATHSPGERSVIRGSASLRGTTGDQVRPLRSTLVVIEGDTFLLAGERIRLDGIDAPDLRHARCDGERERGVAARERLERLLSAANGRPRVRRTGTDVYGFTLARVTADGRDVGETLLAEGHALAYARGSAAKLARIEQWCGASAALDLTTKAKS